MTVLGLSSGKAAGLLFLNRRHPGVELRVKRHLSYPDCWSVEAHELTDDGPKYHWYVVSAAGQVWSSRDGEACDITLRGG